MIKFYRLNSFGDKVKLMFKNFLNQIKKNKSYIVLVIIAIFFIFIGFEYYYRYSYILEDPEKTKEYITSYGNFSIYVFIFMQIIQVIAFFIPGEIVQIAGGYIFGTVLGSILSLTGISIGSSIIYFISNRFGKPFIEKFISEKRVNFVQKALKLGSKKIVIFLLYLIPGLPKDILGYVSGISDINYKSYISYSTLGRVPGIVISAYFGSKMFEKEKTTIIVIATIMSALFIFGVIKGEKIFKNIMTKRKGT